MGREHWLPGTSPPAWFPHWTNPAAFSRASRVDLPAPAGAERLQEQGSRGGRSTVMAGMGPSPPELQYRGHGRFFHATKQKSCSESSSFEFTELLWFCVSGNNNAIAAAYRWAYSHNCCSSAVLRLYRCQSRPIQVLPDSLLHTHQAHQQNLEGFLFCFVFVSKGMGGEELSQFL